MYVTERLVREAVNNAHKVLGSIVPNYSTPYIKDITITNASSYWALISKSKYWEDTFNLRISRSFNLIPDESKAKNRLEECLIHELIHTLPKCWNHGHYFQLYASRINRMYPQYHIQTSTSDSEVGIKRPEKQPKYISRCKGCGNIHKWYRKPNYDIHLYCCSHCGSDVTLEPVV